MTLKDSKKELSNQLSGKFRPVRLDKINFYNPNPCSLVCPWSYDCPTDRRIRRSFKYFISSNTCGYSTDL